MTKRGSSRRTPWATGILVGAAVLGLIAAPFAYSRFELAPLWHDVIGVDVSNHQGHIDWRAVAGSGVAFAYIKATEGRDFRDRAFAANWGRAHAAGIARGAYHFFTWCGTGAEQAKNFIDTVPREAGTLPPVVDAEHMGPCRDAPSMPDIVTELQVFLDTLEKHYGRRPLIYTTSEFEAAFLRERFHGERFWTRSLVLPPRFRTDDWVIWQYHNWGRRLGITGPVDLNVFRGTRREFDAFVSASF